MDNIDITKTQEVIEKTIQKFGDITKALSEKALSKHSRSLPANSRFTQFSYTKRDRYTVRQENRIRNKRARAARKINRDRR